MKLKHGIIALTIAAASVAGVAHAFPGGHCGGQGAGERMEKLASSRLEKLHGDLKLSPDQESAWKAWSGSLQSKFENPRDSSGPIGKRWKSCRRRIAWSRCSNG